MTVGSTRKNVEGKNVPEGRYVALYDDRIDCWKLGIVTAAGNIAMPVQALDKHYPSYSAVVDVIDKQNNRKAYNEQP